MSDALTPDALDQEAAAPEAPAPPVAVEGASADGEAPKLVPAERFNGLQSKYQSDKSEWATEREALLTELENLRQSRETEPVAESPDVMELLEEVRTLRTELARERTDSVLERVLKEYPDAAPFKDMLVGGSEDDLRQAAAAVAERVALLKGGNEVTPESDPEPQVVAEVAAPEGSTQAPPEVGGTVAVTGTEAITDAKQQAIANKDLDGFLSAVFTESELAISRQSVA